MFQELAERIQDYLRRQMPVWRETYEGVETMQLAVMGCIVNGPGESKHADIGISLPGTGEAPAAPVFIDGKKAVTLRGAGIAEEFQKIVADYVANRYPKRAPGRCGRGRGRYPSRPAHRRASCRSHCRRLLPNRAWTQRPSGPPGKAASRLTLAAGSNAPSRGGCLRSPGLVLAMVVLGGITRLNHAGLSIVDWRPLVGVLPPFGEGRVAGALRRLQALSPNTSKSTGA